MVKFHGVREHVRDHVYDATFIAPHAGLLFGNANIGDKRKTNLQCPGQMPGDTTFTMDNWYARTDFARTDEAARAFALLMAHSYAELTIGHKRCCQMPLDLLLKAAPWIPPTRLAQIQTPEEREDFVKTLDEGLKPLVIPPRQSFGVHVNFDTQRAFDFRWIAGIDTIDLMTGPLLWIHLEGVMTRDVGY